MNRKETQMRPLSIMSEPAAYQTDAVINIRLPDASPYVTVSIVNEETGAQVYSMIYAGTNKIQINIENEPEGTYTLHEELAPYEDGYEPEGTYTLYLNIRGAEYTGYFTL